jgi:hypothetical protein
MIDAWESLHSATLELVRSTPIKQRLVAAYRRNLASITEEQLPSEVRATFARVMHAFAGVKPLQGEDAVVATVRKMSGQEADDCAALIVELFGQLCRTGAGMQRPAAAVVQLRTVEVTAPAEFEVPVLTATN